ncbi:ACP S-malonyltransferase [Novosphingobium tardum]|uniref:[acyl-carrier-protein] S-malonyltransferase n=1 Tax=Novosphingobium tardum TaxID=1538021 RepID=A0ABV8RPF9_9SPHN
MKRETVLVVCPGRGTYNAPELGYLKRHHAGRRDLIEAFDAVRTARGEEALSAADGAAAFDPAHHLRGEVATPLIYASGILDFLSIDRMRFEIVAVTGNSMGWYTALACAGAVSPVDGFAIAAAMGTNSQKHGPGGQLLLTLVNEDWHLDLALRAKVEALMPRFGIARSIELGGMLVVAGAPDDLLAFEAALPAMQTRAPLHLPGHGPFHTALMAASSAAAHVELSPSLVGQPAIPLVDGRGGIWRRFETDPAALHEYTFSGQILTPYDFTAAIDVGLKEFAPDRIVLVGPGDTLGGAIGQALVAARWSGIVDKASFATRQERDPFLVAMGKPAQRALIV